MFKQSTNIYLHDRDDPLSVGHNLLDAAVPGDLGVRGLGGDLHLHGVLLHAVDRLQLGGEGVGVGVHLEPAVGLVLLPVLDELHDDGAVVAGVVLHAAREVDGADAALVLLDTVHLGPHDGGVVLQPPKINSTSE